MHSTCIQRIFTQNLGAHPRCNQSMQLGHMPQYRTCTSACAPLLPNPGIHRKCPCCTNSRGTCSQACTIEGEHCEHCTLTFRARHPCSTADPCSCPSRTAAAARARPITLQTFAKKSAAHLAWRRETMQRSQAAFSDSRASLPAPGPLTDAAAIRSVHHPAPMSRRSGAGGQEFY